MSLNLDELALVVGKLELELLVTRDALKSAQGELTALKTVGVPPAEPESSKPNGKMKRPARLAGKGTP